MKKFLQQTLFVIPIALLIAAPFYLDHKKKSETESNSVSGEDIEASALSPGGYVYVPRISPQQYSMSEPFSFNSTMEGWCCGQMQQFIDPETWMQMMNPAMYMNIMHQMMAMPMQMIHMYPNNSMNPHGYVMPQTPSLNMAKPMTPEEYKKWYNEQKKLQESLKQ